MGVAGIVPAEVGVHKDPLARQDLLVDPLVHKALLVFRDSRDNRAHKA
jgi:hypothetical protein